jgi:hypothetical protein
MGHRRVLLTGLISSFLALIMFLMGFMPQIAQARAIDQQPLQRNSVSYSPPQGISFDLQALLAATADTTDTDSDGLPDSVEWVLGTDPENPDSDFDELDDYYEATNGFDPLKADSNSDGLPDNLEINDVAADFDGDKILNVWDSDNDSDGVPDYLDCSPFAKSITSDSFHFDIKTNGNPAYIDFQIRPKKSAPGVEAPPPPDQNPSFIQGQDHLRLPSMVWNWPNDYEGQMRDLDHSPYDVRVAPVLELTVNKRPFQEEVEDYHIVVPEDDAVPSDSGSSFKISGMAIGNVDLSGGPDLLLAGTKNNAHVYQMGWDMQETTTKVMPRWWSADNDACKVTAAFANLENGNNKTDLLMLEDPKGGTGFTYWVGFDINALGKPSPWYNNLWHPLSIPDTSYKHNAGGIAVANVNQNTNPKDVVLMGIGIESSDFGYMIVWDTWVGYDSSLNKLVIAHNGLTGVKTSPPIGCTVDRGNVAVADINGNGIPDLLLMGVSSGTNELVYMVGWDLDYATGDPSFWSDIRKSPSIGAAADGNATAAFDLNNNGKLDLILMGIDNASLHRYHCIIGWDIDTNGQPAGWSPIQEQGTGAVAPMNVCGINIADIDYDNNPELLFQAVDPSANPVYGNISYMIGWDMQSTGTSLNTPSRWSPFKRTYLSNTGILGVFDVDRNGKLDFYYGERDGYSVNRWVGFDVDGHGDPIVYPTYPDFVSRGLFYNFSPYNIEGIDAADINGNGQLDLLMSGFSPDTKKFAYVIGWELMTATGYPMLNPPYNQYDVLSWGTPVQSPSISENVTSGAVKIADINNNGKLDILLMGTDAGGNQLTCLIGWDLNSSGQPDHWGNATVSPQIGAGVNGGGTVVYDLNGNGKLDLLLVAVDDAALHKYSYIVGWDIDFNGVPVSWSSVQRQLGNSRTERLYVPLSPVVDLGTNVAFAGRMFYPAGAPLELSADARLIWMVTGNHDLGEGQMETITLARYKEDFTLTSFSVTENYGTDAGIFYSENKDQTIAAGFVLAYDYLRSQAPLSDVPAQIESRGLSNGSHVMNSQLGSFSHQDAALLGIINQMIPAALDSFAPGKITPIHIALEDDFTSIQMDKIVPTDGGKAYAVDLRGEPVATTKMFKTNWYDTTSKEILEDGILAEIEKWGLESDVFLRVAKLLAAWSAGDITVTRIGSVETQFEMPEAPLVVATLSTVFDFGLAGIDIARASYGIYRYFSTIRPVGESFWRSAVNSCKMVQAVKMGKVAGLNASIRCLNYASELLSVALIFYGFFDIFSSSGWSMEGAGQATYYALCAAVYAEVLMLIGTIPCVGWFLALCVVISDFFGGWFEDLVEEIWDALTDYDMRNEFALDMQNQVIGYDDYDDNGLTIGDQINLRADIFEKVFVVIPYGTFTDCSGAFLEASLGCSAENVLDQDNDRRKRAWVSDQATYYLESWDNLLWAEPNQAAINFPWKITLNYNYTACYNETDLQGTHRKEKKGSGTSDLTTMYFDVLPGNLDDFLMWASTWQNVPVPGEYHYHFSMDPDGDGLWMYRDQDPNNFVWDKDHDGLSDGFELRVSLDPSNADIDGDGLSDLLELRLGTDPKNADTDGDGMSDGAEYQGWDITFTYCGQQFTGHISSDPLMADTDGDGVSDHDEYLGRVWDCRYGNPRSQDTNGDGVKDRLNNIPVIQGIPTAVSVFEGSALNLTGSFVDPDPDTWTATVDYDLDEAPGSQPLALNPDKTFSLSRTFPITPWVNNERLVMEQGHVYWKYTIKISISDDKGGVVTLELPVKYENFIPLVDGGPDVTIPVGSTFTRTCSWTDPGQNDWTVFEAWVNYGDGSGEQELTYVPGAVDRINRTINLSHVYSKIGTFTMTVTYKDEYNEAGSDSAVITVTTMNPPTVNAGADATINEGSAFTSSGNFTDPDSQNWTATVNYGDSSGVKPLTLNLDKTFVLNNTYFNNGTYTVTVTVTDGEGCVGSDNVTVTVNNVAPMVNAGPDATVNEGSSFTSSGNFTDPGADTWTATVNYGDGSGPQPLTLNPDKTFALNHNYSDDGTFTVAVTVTDDDGGVGSDTVLVTVNDLSPTVVLNGDTLLDERQTGSYDASSSTSSPDTIVSYEWDWDYDGVTFNPSGDTGVTQSHAWNDDGTYTAAMRVTDDDGSTDIATLSVTVENPSPGVMVKNLRDDIYAIEDIPASIKNSLTTSLDTANELLEDSNPKNDVAAINALKAFINKVEAQRGKKIPEEIADELITEAQEIIEEISGGA